MYKTCEKGGFGNTVMTNCFPKFENLETNLETQFGNLSNFLNIFDDGNLSYPDAEYQSNYFNYSDFTNFNQSEMGIDVDQSPLTRHLKEHIILSYSCKNSESEILTEI